MIRDPWPISFFIAPFSLLKAHVSLYMTTNLSNSCSTASLTSFGISESASNASVTEACTYQTSQDDFFPFSMEE